MMRELFRLEHKKLWRKASTKISVFLCFVYVVIFGNILSFQWFTFGSLDDYTSNFGNNFDGYEMIRKSKEYSLKYGGELTDESLQQMVRDYQNAKNLKLDDEQQLTDWQIISSWLTNLYPDLQDNSLDLAMSHFLISYVEPDKLTDFYERRQEAIEEFLEISGQTGAEKEYLMQLNEKVKTPFAYEWTEGWSMFLGSMLSEFGIVAALFLAIVLSSLFAGEWHTNTASLVLTTKSGWRQLAYAKILTGISFAVELFAMLAAGVIAVQLFFLGTAGWDMPIQNIKLIAVGSMNMLQAEIYEFGFAFFGSVGFAGVVMLLSSLVKSNVLALLLSLAVYYGPKMVAEYLPYGVQKALDLIPLAGSAADIFRTNTFHIFGQYIWSPYLLITVPVLLGALCMPFAAKGWARRMKV